jgi:AraC-like DNA-binding protein
MSKTRQARLEAGLVVRTFAARHFGGVGIRPHRHDWHQLIYASEGVMTVHAGGGAWVVPPHRAVWVPAGVEHGISMAGPVSVRTLYLAPRVSEALPRACCAVNVSPLLRELILHTVALGMLDIGVPAQARLIAVLVDQLEVLPAVPLQLPMPRDSRAVRLAERLRARPSDPASLDQLAEGTGASARTLERLFRVETGLTFGQWRQRLRLLEALRLLADGRPVTAVAFDVGYESPSAFIAMFRHVLGTTPGRFFDRAKER